MVATAILTDQAQRETELHLFYTPQQRLSHFGHELSAAAARMPGTETEAVTLAVIIRAGATALRLLSAHTPSHIDRNDAAEFRARPEEFLLGRVKAKHNATIAKPVGLAIHAHRVRSAIDLNSRGQTKGNLMTIVETAYAAIKECEGTPILNTVITRTQSPLAAMKPGPQRATYSLT